jgi:hypothetical protein
MHVACGMRIAIGATPTHLAAIEGGELEPCLAEYGDPQDLLQSWSNGCRDVRATMRFYFN